MTPPADCTCVWWRMPPGMARRWICDPWCPATHHHDPADWPPPILRPV